MFSFGFWEILVIGVIALLVVGPERLPALATFTGQWVGRLRRMARHLRSEIQNELEAEHMKNLLADQQSELNQLRREVAGVRDQAQTAVRETREKVGEIEGDVKGSDSRTAGRKPRRADTETGTDAVGDDAEAATADAAGASSDASGTRPGSDDASQADAATTDDKPDDGSR